MTHYEEDDLVLYYYGEGRYTTARSGARSPRSKVARHLDECAACAATYREIAVTLAMVAPPDVPERGEQYELEVWQRIRHQLPEQDSSWWTVWFRHERLVLVAAAASLVLAAFAAGRFWPRGPAGPAPVGVIQSTAGGATNGDLRQRVVLTSVADHLDRSERWLTDIMNSPAQSDISTAQRWAEDLLTTSRLYRQDAVDVGEQSVASVLDDLERSLLEIVHSPSKISAADLEQIRRRIDAAALLFKVRVLSDELRQREAPRTSITKTS